MPWGVVKLSTGAQMPTIAIGTWKMGRESKGIEHVQQAIHVGLRHIDTAQNYRNEPETGKALALSGIYRSELFITTKFSGLKDVESSINDSLKFLATNYVDLYLIHGPTMAKGDIPGLWKKMEKIYDSGKAKAIGVSNFGVEDLNVLLQEARVIPAVNQILLHPYVYAEQISTIQLCQEKGIIVEAYSPLIPVTSQPGGPLDPIIRRISERTGATVDQVLLAWSRIKGFVVVTGSNSRSRLEGYVKAGDLELRDDEITAIDEAGFRK